MIGTIELILVNSGIEIPEIIKSNLPDDSETESIKFHSTLRQLTQSIYCANKQSDPSNTQKAIKLTDTYLALVRDFKTYREEQLTPTIGGITGTIEESLENYIHRKDKELRKK